MEFCFQNEFNMNDNLSSTFQSAAVYSYLRLSLVVCTNDWKLSLAATFRPQILMRSQIYYTEWRNAVLRIVSAIFLSLVLSSNHMHILRHLADETVLSLLYHWFFDVGRWNIRFGSVRFSDFPCNDMQPKEKHKTCKQEWAKGKYKQRTKEGDRKVYRDNERKN